MVAIPKTVILGRTGEGGGGKRKEDNESDREGKILGSEPTKTENQGEIWIAISRDILEPKEWGGVMRVQRNGLYSALENNRPLFEKTGYNFSSGRLRFFVFFFSRRRRPGSSDIEVLSAIHRKYPFEFPILHSTASSP